MIVMLKYGSGLPFNRIQRLQSYLEIPLPASTQWQVIDAFAPQVVPAYEELLRQAAAGDVLYHDDTTVRILELMGERAKKNAFEEGTKLRSIPSSGCLGTIAPRWREPKWLHEVRPRPRPNARGARRARRLLAPARQPPA
jgi:hypothetical protein